ncbi:uncharacterized protein EV154DRAFT_549554 [Mucor mucedo]|uniref:uncharacterized protein n=1 Tax=Mucor mucedo TaxID=29922 RepID=UPI00221E702F|nr:uncharacterized protein EV154DRAFT_549554 [Mucor mucedo]KAI7893869.1 hypothetical protein EV154DRAFT_549554 [Mucor mucedo]
MSDNLKQDCISSLHATADVITPRIGSNCAYTLNKIYCYGGKLENKHYDNSIYALDLNSLSPGPVTDLINKWTLVTVNPSPGVPQDEYRYASQFVQLPDGSLFFDGGYNENNPLVAQNITYNPQKNIWSVLPGPGYDDVKNGGYRQIFSAAAVYLPNVNRIAYYGGRQLNAVQNFTYTSNKPLANLTYEVTSELDPTKKLVESIYGYNYLTELNLDTRVWAARSTEPLVINNFPIQISDQTATYHPGTKAIIFLGGFIKNELLVGMTRPLNYFLLFDTESSLWKTQNTDGLNTPTARLGHTATMLNTGDDILMYGGLLQSKDETVEGVLSADYLYTLNLITFRWSVYDRPPDSIGPRAHHSAVLVNGTSLFIMFGQKKSETANALVTANDMMVLNVTDLPSLTSLSTYPKSVNGDSTTNKTSTDGQSGSQSDSQSDTQSKGLSGGAIAGIVVGIVAVVAIVALAAVYRKRNKDKEEKMKELHVNWDEIDNEYREDPHFGTGFSVGTTNMSTTAASPTVSEKPSQHHHTYSPALAETNLIKPDVHDDLPTRIKPDGTRNN